MEQENKKLVRTIIIIIVILLMISLPVLFVVNKLRTIRGKNKFALKGYTVSMGLFPSLDMEYEKTDE